MDETAAAARLLNASLARLADKLGHEWRSLGIFLGLEKAQVDRCDADHPRNMLMAIHDMLVMWRRKTASRGPQKQVALLVQALNEISRKDLAEAVEDGDFVVDEDSGGPIQLEKETMDKGHTSHTSNVRGDHNIVIQTGDNAKITVHGQVPGTSSEGGHDEYRQSPPPSGHTSLPNLSGIRSPNPVPRAFSQDESQLSLEANFDDCVSRLQAMGFSDRQVRPVVRHIISTGLTEPREIVRTAVETISEDSGTRGQQGIIRPGDTSTFDSLDGPRMPQPLQIPRRASYPHRHPDASIYDLHDFVQMDSLRDNEASNWPEGEFPSIADDGGEVQPLIDLSHEGQHPDTTRTPMDASIPPLSQQPLSPRPAASEQQNTTETTEHAENQHTELTAAAEDPEQADTDDEGSDDTNNTVPKAIQDGEASPSAGNQRHPEVQQQQNQGVGNNKPAFDEDRRLYVFTKDHIVQMTDNSEAKEIAVGAFGPVYYVGKFPYEGPLKDKPVAIKVNRSADQGKKEFMQELAMARSPHPHLLPLYGICEDDRCLSLISPYMINKDLKSWIQEKKPADWKTRLVIALDLVSAIRHYHKQIEGSPSKKYHRDVKSANVFLDARHRARLGDPGLMTEVPKDKTHLTRTGSSTADCGTLYYQDPYYMKYRKYHETSDHYSAGKVLLELLTSITADAEENGRLLFEKWFEDKEYFELQSDGTGLCEVADHSVAVGWPGNSEDGSSVTQQFAKLIISCLQERPKKRIALEELYQKLKDLVMRNAAIGNHNKVMPDLCMYCLACKPCPIPMACQCELLCSTCMRSHTEALYCPNHHNNTTGLGCNTFAIVVGQKGFEDDAKGFKDVITNASICGVREENVKLLINAKLKDVEDAVAEAATRIQQVSKDQETIFLYYHSGHGQQRGLEFDQITVWTRKLQKIFKESKATKSLFILDACNASSIEVYTTKGGPGESSSNNEEVGTEEPQELERDVTQDPERDVYMLPGGSMLWASCRKAEASGKKKNTPSVFTKYIINGLKGGDCGVDNCSDCMSFQRQVRDIGAVSLHLLSKFVYNHVKRELKNQQIPSLKGQQEATYWMAYAKH